MPLISKKDEPKTIKKGIVFEESIYNTIDSYIEFLGMKLTDESRDYIVSESLRFLFSKDKEFQKYLANSSTAEKASEKIESED